MKKLLFGLTFCLCLATAAAAQSGKRIALVVGNSDYASAPVLPNPVNDAAAIGAALERLGFTVHLGLDQSFDSLRNLIYDFSLEAEGAELALFFYAGHGLQVAGKNYLIPIDAALERETDLDFATIDLQLVLKQLERSAKTSVVLLDACRDNPFETRLSRSMGVTRSAAALGRGLAPVETLGGALIGFATDPGEVAFDGQGTHSPFTEALLTHIETPGLEINTMMTRVRADVVTATDRRQRPWATSSLLNEVYLAPQEAAEPELEPNPFLEDVTAWRTAEASGTADAYQDYLTRFPKVLFADQAERSLRIVTEPREEEEMAAIAPPKPRPDGIDIPSAGDDAPILEPLKFGDIGFKSVLGKPFLMGSSTHQAGTAEKPVVQVYMSSFVMSQSEITVGQFRRFVETSGYTPPQGCYIWTDDGRMRWRNEASWTNPGYSVADASPVACVNWDDARAYAEWLAQDTGQAVRLPSEAELEYAIRAGREDDYPFSGGAEAACQTVNAADASSRFRWRNAACDDGFQTVATAADLRPNAFGLVAMTGNLWEWAADCWNPSHRGARSDGSARLTGQCESRVLRGGSWDDPIENLRSSYRVGIPAKRRQANVGFRVVIEN